MAAALELPRTGVAVLDFIAIAATPSEERLTSRFSSSLNSSGSRQSTTSSHFHIFAAANSVVSPYLVLSLAFSIFHVIRSGAQNSRVVLILFDAGMMALLAAGAAAAAAIVYLAHKGNTRANWFAICQQFNSFCERISGSLIRSFVGIVVFVLLILMSAITPRAYLDCLCV